MKPLATQLLDLASKMKRRPLTMSESFEARHLLEEAAEKLSASDGDGYATERIDTTRGGR